MLSSLRVIFHWLNDISLLRAIFLREYMVGHGNGSSGVWREFVFWFCCVLVSFDIVFAVESYIPFYWHFPSHLLSLTISSFAEKLCANRVLWAIIKKNSLKSPVGQLTATVSEQSALANISQWIQSISLIYPNFLLLFYQWLSAFSA